MAKNNSPEEGVKMNSSERIRKAPNIDVSGDLFSFKGGSTGCVMILEPLSPIYNYYEYVIVDRGVEASVGVGLAERNYPLHRMPGWNRNGIGYHGDDGKLYHESGGGRRFGSTCTTGDRMGCGIDFDQDYTDGYYCVFFTKNGEQVSDSIRMKRPTHGLYPIIGLHSQGEKVRYLGHWHRQRESLLEPMIVDTSPHNQWLRSNGIHYLEDGMTLEYCGLGDDAQDPALAQARFPLNRTNHYFEFLILSSGNIGAIAIGLGKCTYELHNHPGWSHGAVGYHADDGKLFVERGMGIDFGPPCSEGDRMGCGVLFDELDDTNDKNDDENDGNKASGELDNFQKGDEDRSTDSDWSSESSFNEDIDDLFDEDDMMGALREARRLQRGDRAINQMMPLVNRARRRQIGRYGGLGVRGPMMGNPFGGLMGVPAQGAKPPSAKDSLSVNNSSNSCVVFFTKNGETVGKTKINIPKDGLYPIIGLMSKGERVKVDLQPLSG